MKEETPKEGQKMRMREIKRNVEEKGDVNETRNFEKECKGVQN